MSKTKSKVIYPDGAQLHDVRYNKNPECFEVVYWDPTTKRLEVVYEDPIIDIWFLKEENRTNEYQLPQVNMDDCYPVYCKPSQIPKVIADNIGGEWKEIYDRCKAVMMPNALKRKMCECPWVFKADLLPDVYFRLKWLKEHGPDCDVSNVSFALLDIECDVIDKTINLRDIHDVTQPINAVSIILPEQKICALMVLGPRPKHKLHEKFHDLLAKQEKAWNWLLNNEDEFKKRIVEFDPDNKKYLDGYDVRVHTFNFDEEINLIKTVFDYINKYRPMFTLSWNAKFDDNYLMNRISYLGYDPYQIIIPSEFKTHTLYYQEDKSGETKDENGKKKAFSLENSRDWFFTSTYSVYACQERIFAAVRKSQQKPRSYSLSYIGKTYAGIDKLTNTKSGTFREFAYTDFIKFLLYNIRDVVVQLAIELIVGDCRTIFSQSYMFATQYSKIFQETHIVRNHREDFYESQGQVQACALKSDPNADTSFKGAYVAPPDKNAPTGFILNGKRVNNIIYGAWDADAKAYYPSTKIGTNQDPMSLLYKCKINNDLFRNKKCINRSFNQEYLWYDSKNRPHEEDMAGPIINSYKNGNIKSVCYNWLNLPSISECFEYLDAALGTRT